MISALLSFLGGSVFRMLWGEIASWINKKQDHTHEIERMKLQGELEAAQHARNLEAIKIQAELGVKVIEAQAQSAVDQLEAEGWLEAVKSTGRKVGIAWVDAWNQVIRPGLATWSIFMLTCNEFGVFKISEETATVCFASLGIYLADRALGKRGK
jgi:hypothetical protein